MKARWITHLLGLAMSVAAVTASAQVFSGHFDDRANTALFASDLGAAGFADDSVVANNVALYDFTVALPGTVTITSSGFAAGGADPYFSLFEGAGGTATFLASNYDQAFSTGGDFGYVGLLAAGAYRLAIGVFANLSFAENFGSGSLADGFSALGMPGSLGDAGYRVRVTAPVPEASQWALLLVGLLAVGFATRRGLGIGVTAALLLAAPLSHAAEAGGNVRAYAQDPSALPFNDEHKFSGLSSDPPVVSYSVDSVAGNSIAHAQVSADGYTGAMRAKFSSTVAATSYSPGRGATASGAASLTGSIGITGMAPPGVATFSAVLEGTYSDDPFSTNNSIGLEYTFRVGASPEFNGRLDYSRATGSFAVPFSWTQTVQPGDTIDFSMYLRGSATAGFGLAELAALNTFKITAIDLPPGYSFTPDADGFLSQFGAAATPAPTPTTPVPEPATAALTGIGLLALAWVRRRIAERRPG